MIAEANFSWRFTQLVEALGYARIGTTTQGFHTVRTPNGPVTHASEHCLPQPLFEGVEAPVQEGFGRRVYKVKPVNEEVTQ